jgi:hypothetical protein
MPEEDPDIVRVILERVTPLIPEAERAMLLQIEQTVRTEYGGLRVRIRKRKKHMSEEQRRQVFEDALSNKPEPEILARHGIHRATLYRVVKRGVTSRG